jgi:hypothetical protein
MVSFGTRRAGAFAATMKIDDQALIIQLKELLAREREARADFIAHLAEFDRRRLYLVAGFPTLFAWLTTAMRMSNASAFRRATAARLVTTYPSILAALRNGRVSLNKVCALREAFTADNVDQLLRRAAAMTEREVEELASRMTGRPLTRPLRDSIIIIPSPAPDPNSHCDDLASVTEANSPDEGARPVQQRITISVGPEFLQLLDEVRAALSHSHPNASVEALLGACMKAMLTQKARKVRAEVKRPRPPTSKNPKGRHVPAAVRRAVWKRDDARCTFVSASGRRCGATSRLQLHHRIPFARGGRATVENLTLLCRQHNDLAARQEYGDAHMDAYSGR